MSKQKKILGAMGILCIIGFIKWFGITEYLTIEYIHSHIAFLNNYVAQNYALAVVCYLASYIIASACAIPGSSVFLMIAGMLFGIFPGIVYALIGTTLGATCLCMISRYIVGLWLQEKYNEKFAHFNHELAIHGVFYLFIVRLISITPFFVTNILVGLTLVPIRTLSLTTAIGSIPGALVYAFIGQQLTTLQNIENLYSGTVLIAFIIFILFKIIIFIISYKWIRSMRLYKKQQMLQLSM